MSGFSNEHATAEAWRTLRLAFHPLSLLRIVVKRKWLIAGIWLLTSIPAVLAIFRLPAVYSAETIILVDPQRIPETYVASTVNMDLQERLDKLKQEILSFDRLYRMIIELDLYRDQRPKRLQEEVVEFMRRDIALTLEKGWSADRAGAFRVAYRSPNPVVAAKVTNRIARFFIEENARARQTQAASTSNFLESQMIESKRNLEAQEERLRRYKLAYNGELPEQENALIAQLGQSKTELVGAQDALNRAHQNKLILENALASAVDSLKVREEAAARGAEEATMPVQHGASAPDPPPTPTEKARAELNGLRSRYSDRHPDVQAAVARLRRLEEAEAAERAANTVPPSPDTSKGSEKRKNAKVVESDATIAERERVKGLRAQLQALDVELARIGSEPRRIQADASSLQSRLGRLPIREQQLAAITRDYQISKASYQSLLDKKLAADVAANMEKRKQAETFIMLDDARIPEKPIRPKRAMLIAFAVVGALAVALTVALGVELRSDRLLGEWEFPRGTSILGRVPAAGT